MAFPVALDRLLMKETVGKLVSILDFAEKASSGSLATSIDDCLFLKSWNLMSLSRSLCISKGVRFSVVWASTKQSTLPNNPNRKAHKLFRVMPSLLQIMISPHCALEIVTLGLRRFSVCPATLDRHIVVIMRRHSETWNASTVENLTFAKRLRICETTGCWVSFLDVVSSPLYLS